jgi:phosphonate transport system permease protein
MNSLEHFMSHCEKQFASDSWELQRVVSKTTIGILLLFFLFLGWSIHNTGMDKATVENIKAIGSLMGLCDSKVVSGAVNFLERAFPLQIASRVETSRIDGFDRAHLPWFSHIEIVEEKDYDMLTETYSTEKVEYLVYPLGYLFKVLKKMWETIEIAFWGTMLSIMISLPLGIIGAGAYTPNKIAYFTSRGILGFHRAMPELIIALFFVLMYGFGPVAGIFALAVHTSGVLGKFFADEIENAPPGPQEALKATGANRLKVLRFSVLPQVLPQYVAYVQYIFERNIRTATILGIVGAGGIGVELKGRWDLFDYAHVSTILLVIFLTVMLLEYLSQKLRSRSL